MANAPTPAGPRHYILAPDVLLSYPGVIPGEKSVADPPQLVAPTEDDPLYNARLIIPDIAVDILSELSGEPGPMGRNATCALHRLSEICKNSNQCLQHTYNLRTFARTNRGTCAVCILPLSESVLEVVPYNPLLEDDYDGLVALTALEAVLIAKDKFINGHFAWPKDSGTTVRDYFSLTSMFEPSEDDFVLVTNRPATVLKANMLGVRTMPYHLTQPLPYTGIRYVAVTDELYFKFHAEGSITAAEWQEAMPLEEPLIANEYIVMYPMQLLKCYPDTPTVGRIDPKSKIVIDNPTLDHDYTYVGVYKAEAKLITQLKHIRPFYGMIPFNNPEYAAYVDALHDPDIDTVIVTGAAGTGKTYGAFNTALDDCQDGLYMHAIVVKEGKNVLGAVPGDVEDKMAPVINFGKDALSSRVIKSEEIVKKRTDEQKYGVANGNHGATAFERTEEIVQMKWSHNFTSVPYEYAQGRTFNNCFIILDEFQRTEVDMADTLLTRQGHKSKMVVLGDIAQIQNATISKRAINGLTYAHALFRNAPCAAVIHLRRILRSDSAGIVVSNRSYVRTQMGLSD